MEKIWVMRELGTEMYKTIEENKWQWKFLRSKSQAIPGDVYCRCDIYVEIPNSKQATLFVLKYPQATPVPRQEV